MSPQDALESPVFWIYTIAAVGLFWAIQRVIG